MKIDVQLTEEDYVKANYLHLRPRPAVKWAGYFLLFWIVVVLVMSVYMAIAHSTEILIPILVGSLLAYLWFAFGFWTPNRCRKTFRQLKMLQMPFSFEFTDGVIITKSECSEAKLTWDHFRKWKEGKDLFTLYQSDRMMQMIPKRVFSSPEEMTQFRELLAKKIGAASP